jgi:hypothetical protein
MILRRIRRFLVSCILAGCLGIGAAAILAVILKGLK